MGVPPAAAAAAAPEPAQPSIAAAAPVTPAPATATAAAAGGRPDSGKPAQFRGSETTGVLLRPEDADRIGDEDFGAYCSKLYMYLQVVENRLFSEGLHVLGEECVRVGWGRGDR